MTDCDKAKEYIQDFIEENDLEKYVSTSQVEDAIEACCNDVGSQQCLRALSVLNSTAGCIALTEGACVPCCEVAGGLVGPIVAAGIGWAWGAIKDAWETVKGWFGGGGCDYDPAADKIVKASADAFRKVAVSLQEAWERSRDEMYLPPKPALFVRGAGGLMVPIALTQESITAHMGKIIPATWEQALLHNTVRTWILHWTNVWKKSKWTAGVPPIWTHSLSGEDDVMYSRELSVTGTTSPEQFFDFGWRNWDCKHAEQWETSARNLNNTQMAFVNRAVERLAADMAVALGREAKEGDMERVAELAHSMKISNPAMRIQNSDSGSGLGWLLGLAVLGAAGYGAYKLKIIKL